MTNEEVYQRAYDEIKLRGLSPHTVEEYLGKLTVFLRFFDNRPIDTMGEEEIRQFLLYQLDSGKTSGTVNIYNSALRFIFGAVLGKKLNYQRIPRRKQYRELPAIMSKTEIVRFFSVIDNLRDKAMFETVYGAGLRISEIARLRTQDIDSEQMRIFVYHGKGGKDRYTLLSQRNLEILREYWKQYRPNNPEGYLFYARSRDKHTLVSSCYECFLQVQGYGQSARYFYRSYPTALFRNSSVGIRRRTRPNKRAFRTYLSPDNINLSALKQC